MDTPEQAPDPLLLDVTGVDECCTNIAIDTMYKAMVDRPGDDDALFEPHPDPLIRGTIEGLTARMQRRIGDAIDSARRLFARWRVAGWRAPTATLPPASGAGVLPRMLVGDALARELQRLERTPVALYTVWDWLTWADTITARLAPPELLANDAEMMAVRGRMAARIRANILSKPSTGPTDFGPDAEQLAAEVAEVEHAPTTAAGWMATPEGDAGSIAGLAYGTANAAESLAVASAALQHRIRATLVAGLRQVTAGEVATTPAEMESRLLEGFANLNRDWRRVAITETGEAASQGLIASLPFGSIVERREAYRGACPWCQSINGRRMVVCDPNDPNRDGDIHVWAGKTNEGRSAAKFKRVGGILVLREAIERWWIAAGNQHPNCRGRWLLIQRGDGFYRCPPLAPPPANDGEQARRA